MAQEDIALRRHEMRFLRQIGFPNTINMLEIREDIKQLSAIVCFDRAVKLECDRLGNVLLNIIP